MNNELKLYFTAGQYPNEDALIEITFAFGDYSEVQIHKLEKHIKVILGMKFNIKEHQITRVSQEELIEVNTNNRKIWDITI